MTDNPYVIARLTMTGADYRGELHAARVNDVDTPPPALTDFEMRMFSIHYPAASSIDEALTRIGDLSLTAEVRRHRAREREIERIGEERQRLENACYHAGLAQGMSRARLQEAQRRFESSNICRMIATFTGLTRYVKRRTG